MFGLKSDWILDPPPRYYTLEDYEYNVPRWCSGCGDHAVLTSIMRICRDEQLKPEKTVFVSGIGCSSRFPHYMKTYGFHSLHGRAFPVACGVKSRRPDVDVFVATGDGDCCSIGAGHWIHAIRYNMNLTAMLFDNSAYGLTKNQTSPTSPVGYKSNTHPRGSWLAPLNPLTATLGVTNVSYVAQTVDWNPIHLHATLHHAFKHRGFSFVRILQRCPQYTANRFAELQQNPERLLYLKHPNGVAPDDQSMLRMYKNTVEHDPMDLGGALELSQHEDRGEAIPIGALYVNPSKPCYDDFTNQGLGMSPEEKIAAFDEEIDRFAV